MIQLVKYKENDLIWIKQHYICFNSNIDNFKNILNEDSLNFNGLYDSYFNQSFFDVLFIKYEKLIINDYETMNELYNFTNIKPFKFKPSKPSKPFDLNIEIDWHKELEERIESYNVKLLITNNILKLRHAGFGSNINQVINSCIYVELNKQEPFYVIWNNNCYLKKDIFKLYFDQPFFKSENIEINKNMNLIKNYFYGYITPRDKSNLELSKCVLLPPSDRFLINNIINKYIKINNKIINIKNNFLSEYSSVYKIGIHIRGTGRIKHLGDLKCKEQIEFYYLQEILNHIFEIKKNYVIIIFTDNKFSLNYFINIFKNIKYYNSNRTDDNIGEIHLKNKDIKTFEDILVETEIMSSMDYLIHGNSNITNYVLCKNPYLKSYDIYNKLYSKITKD